MTGQWRGFSFLDNSLRGLTKSFSTQIAASTTECVICRSLMFRKTGRQRTSRECNADTSTRKTLRAGKKDRPSQAAKSADTIHRSDGHRTGRAPRYYAPRPESRRARVHKHNRRVTAIPPPCTGRVKCGGVRAWSPYAADSAARSCSERPPRPREALSK